MRILLGAPVRQTPDIFRRHLDSLDALRVPDGVTTDRYFLLHNSPDLAAMLPAEQYAHWQADADFKVDAVTHHWTRGAVAQVAAMKNVLLKRALDKGFSHLFLVDSDLVLHPETLAQLLAHEKDLCAEVFWTRWQPDAPELPNAWDFDHYTFLRDSLERWRTPGLYPVGMSGACILISRTVLKAGVTYSQIPNLTLWGEDRHFCIRAACAGFQVWLDTHHPAQHLYRPSDA